jgi:hypothetical protein
MSGKSSVYAEDLSTGEFRHVSAGGKDAVPQNFAMATSPLNCEDSAFAVGDHSMGAQTIQVVVCHKI